MNAAWYTMTVANKWNTHDSPVCPLCTQTNETCDHVLYCQNHHMCRVRDKYLRNLQQQLSQLNTDPNISKCITTEITAWLKSNQQPSPQQPTNHDADTNIDNTLTSAIQNQRTIGWGNFLRGFISKDWIRIQDEYYSITSFVKNFNIHLWTNKIIEATILIAHKLWRERCEIINTTIEYSLEQ